MAVCRERIFHRPVFFTALLSLTVFSYFGVQGPFTTGILTTLQREFKFKSSEIGILLTVNDIVGLIVVTPMAYFCAKRHRPRILGILTLVFALGCFVSAIPQFIGNYDAGPVNDNANDTDTDPMMPPKAQVVELCVAYINDTDAIEEKCSAAEQAASGAQYNRAVWLYIGMALCGIGGAGYFPLGITYIDDGVSKTSSSVHVAALFMMGSLAPIFGFSISALSLSYHTDFYKIDVDELGYDAKDPRWIGAWWLGYIIYTGIFIIISIPFFFFPKVWPHREDEKVEMSTMNGSSTKEEEKSSPDAYMIKNILPKEGTTLMDIIKGYFRTLTRLLTNITYLACLMAVCAELASLAGFFSFAGRYIQTQYGVTPSMTSVLLGSVITPVAFLGNLFGGLIVKKMRLSMRGLAMMSVAICGTVFLLIPLYFVVGCDNTPIAGVTVPYPGESVMVMTPSCIGNCDCTSGTYTPVCGSDGITYITPCHAGCTEYIDGTDATTSFKYSECSCIGSNATFDDTIDTPDDFSANQEACPRDCFSRLIGFMIIFGASGLINSMIKNPSFMLKIRCVDEQDRAMSLGLGSLIIRVLGFVPAPIYFGAAIQTTCLMFQQSCGKTGNCLIYDSNRLRNAIYGLLLVLKFASLICYSISCISIRRDKSGVYHPTELCRKRKQKAEAV